MPPPRQSAAEVESEDALRDDVVRTGTAVPGPRENPEAAAVVPGRDGSVGAEDEVPGRARADRTVDRLHFFVRALGPTDQPWEGGPEAHANAADLYLKGWAETLSDVDPTMVSPVLARISRALCDEHLSDGETLVLMRAGFYFIHRAAPLQEGLQCILRQRTREDIVLWTALRLWQAARFDRTSEWEQWRVSASDRRTQRLFDPNFRREGPGVPSLTTRNEP